MSFYYQPVMFTPGVDWVCLREISGNEEQEIDDTGAAGAIRLLDQLIVDAPPKAPWTPGSAQRLSLPDRDRLLAGIYSRTFGSRIESTLECDACAAPFDLDFSLETFLQHLYSESQAAEVTRHEDSSFSWPNGLRLRLPTGEDELAVWGLPPEEAEKQLMEHCVLEGDLEAYTEEVQESLQQAAPMLATEMAARCPECGHQMEVHFDVQSYLLNALKMDKKRLSLEVHRLAATYKWSLGEILQLPRSMRKSYASLIESEMEALYAR